MSWNPFRAPSRSATDWFPVGLASSFPDIGQEEEPVEDGALLHPRPCADQTTTKPSCKAFHVPKTDPSQRKEVSVADEESADAELDMTDQVLVFQYRGKFHAIDHVSFALENYFEGRC